VAGVATGAGGGLRIYCLPTGQENADEYAAILQKLSEHGFIVLSEQRPKNTDVIEYAQKIVDQIRKLLDAGVPASNIKDHTGE
jgi:hypothetical protein